MTKATTHFKKPTFWLIVALGISLIINFSQYFSIRSLEYKRILYDIGVADIELGGSIIFYGQPTRTGLILKKEKAGDVGYGKTTGFVTFHTQTDQPQSIRQYYTIQSSKEYDEEGNQVFYLIETLKMAALPPRQLDPEKLFVEKDNSKEVLFKSENGTLIKINKITRDFELDNGEAYLITDDYNFMTRMKELYWE